MRAMICSSAASSRPERERMVAKDRCKEARKVGGTAWTTIRLDPDRDGESGQNRGLVNAGGNSSLRRGGRPAIQVQGVRSKDAREVRVMPGTGYGLPGPPAGKTLCVRRRRSFRSISPRTRRRPGTWPGPTRRRSYGRGGRTTLQWGAVGLVSYMFKALMQSVAFACRDAWFGWARSRRGGTILCVVSLSVCRG